MFTGLVQTVGTVRAAADDDGGGKRVTVSGRGFGKELAPGESVAVDGACMTVVERGADGFTFQAGPESLARTTLGGVAAGTPVNLERALRAGDLLGGHFVTGHVDTVGRILARVVSGDWETVWFGFDGAWAELLVEKGSVAVDGISLTVVDVQPDRFSVMLIPHTREQTTLGAKAVGGGVNLEFDLLAKHVRRLVKPPHS